MKIGKPISEVPAAQLSREGSKYRDVYEAVGSLEQGQVLPLECESREEVNRLFQGTRGTLITQGYRLNVRGSTLYITRDGAK